MRRVRLPNRPLALRGGHQTRAYLGAAIALVIGVALALGTSCSASTALTILGDQRVWDRGVAAEHGSIRGKRTSKFGLQWFMASYDADVEYEDSAGQRYEGSLSFMTMLGGPDVSGDADLRYDPDDHGRFAVSWGVDASGARWRATIVLTLLLALCTLAFLWIAVLNVRALRAQRRRVATGDEVELLVLGCTQLMEQGKPTGKWRHELATIADDGTPARRFSHDAPWLLYCTPDQTRVLAVGDASKPGELVILEHDGSPLVLSAAERAAIS